MPPFSQAAASHRLYPWGPSLRLPAAPGPAVRLPAAPQLVLPPCKTIPGLTRAVRKRWKPSCPSHSPCRDAGLRPRPPGHRQRRAPPTTKDLPPPPPPPRRAATPHQVPGQAARSSPQLSGAGRRGGFAADGSGCRAHAASGAAGRRPSVGRRSNPARWGRSPHAAVPA